MRRGSPSPGPCPVCETSRATPVLDVEATPVLCNALARTREEALAFRTGRIELAFCPECMHLFNRAFDPGLLNYSPEYDNSLHFSNTFNTYAQDLVDDLVSRFDLRGKSIVEVGCGNGEFLQRLCEAGNNEGLGFDRSYGGTSDPAGTPMGEASNGRVRFVPDFLSWDSAAHEVDFLTARHVLEHLADPLGFLVDIRRWLGPDRNIGFYFEVPNALWTVDRGGIWDVIYEHPSFFSMASLLHLMGRAGFRPETWGEAFGGQYLQVSGGVSGLEEGAEPSTGAPVEAVSAKTGNAPIKPETAIHGFGLRFDGITEGWARWVRAARREHRVIALWGAGSKGVTFLNLLDPGPGVRFIVDINPRKQGRFVPGTGHEILPPESLVIDQPDVVLIANPLYVEEIGGMLAELGIHAELVVIGEEAP